MAEYLYIFSNPSMPGLIKVGRTETSPSQRMIELHTTGVPTQFVLEFSAEVDDCVISEKAAHRALRHFRVHKKREFFAVAIPQALMTILPVIGSYKLIEVRDAHGIAEVETGIKRRREELERQKADRVEAEKERVRENNLRQAAERSARMKEIRLLEEAVTEEKQKLEQLGPRPLLQTFPAGGSEWLFLIVWPPLVLVWFGMPYVFGIKLSTSMKVGTTLVIFMIFGFFSDRIDKRYRERFDKAIEPFRPGDNKIAELEAEIKQKKGISSSPSRIIW